MPEKKLPKLDPILRFLQKNHKQKFQFFIITTKSELTAVCQKIKKSKIIYVNIQGTDLDPQISACAGVSIAYDEKSLYFIPRHNNEAKGTLFLHELFLKLKPLLADEKIEKIMHNAQYNRTIFQRNDAPVQGKVFDIMTAINLILHTQSPQDNEQIVRDFYGKQAAVSYQTMTAAKKISDDSGLIVGVDPDLWHSIADVHQTIFLHSFLQKELAKKKCCQIF